jgi:F5/8 type C domain/GDSL-like Lipase/Acylhydrolase family
MNFRTNRVAKMLRLVSVALLLALLLVNIGVEPASARPIEDPPPPPPPTDPIPTVPTTGIKSLIPGTGFDWAANTRYNTFGAVFGSWYWNENESRYNPDYIHPSNFRLTFNGCVNQADRDSSFYGNPTTYLYEWNVHGQVITARSCYLEHYFPVQADYNVSLTVKNLDNSIFKNAVANKVTVKDLLVVAIGDSYGAGEGAPDFAKTDTSDAQWQSKRCHRSVRSAASKAAVALEREDPKTSVTFISFACSGATIASFGYYKPGLFNGLNLFNYSIGDFLGINPYDLGDPLRPVGSGITGIYRGIEPVRDDFDTHYYLPSQIDQARNAIRIPGTNNYRPIDALIMSAGGNDMGFSKIATVCVLHTKCYNHPVRNRFAGQYGQPDEVTLSERFMQDWGAMPSIFDYLQSNLHALNPKHTFIVEYPDSTTDSNGVRCQRILNDVLPSFGVFELTQVEVDWVSSQVVPRMNEALTNAAFKHGWTFVDGVTAAYHQHGYCASDANRYINNTEDSSNKQGGLSFDTTGTLHPNDRGYQAIADRIGAFVSPKLNQSNNHPANLARGAAVVASSSYEQEGWGAAKATDGNRNTNGVSNGWTSHANLHTNHTEWVRLDMGSVKTAHQVVLYPRNDPWGGLGHYFPEDFSIWASTDASCTNWTMIASRGGVTSPGGSPVTVNFPPTQMRCMQINSTKLRFNPNENAWRVQFTEIEVY